MPTPRVEPSSHGLAMAMLACSHTVVTKVAPFWPDHTHARLVHALHDLALD